MPAETQATAEGDLGRTPFAHLLVYAIDRRLTGALFLNEPSGVEHVIRLARGAPVKVRPGDKYALLGQLLVEAGAITERTLGDALATKGLLGDVLLLAGCVERDVLEGIAEDQFVRRIVRFFALPAETTYRYFDGHYELLDYGGDPSNVDPLHLLWAGLSMHGDASTMIQGTLDVVGDAPLALHAAAPVDRFGFGETERLYIDHLKATPTPIKGLLDLGLAPEALVRKLIYALLITRQIDLGRGTLPCGVEEIAAAAQRSAQLGKVQMRSIVHREGAAAPDAPGDGERARTSSLRRREEEAVATSSESDLAETSRTPPAGIDDSPSLTIEEADELEASTSPLRPGTATSPNLPSAKEALRAALNNGEAGGVVNEPTPQVASLPPAELYQLARARLENKDLRGALEACSMACSGAPDNVDYAALALWVRASLPGADVKAITIELDEIIASHEAHVDARYYRAVLRKRLSNDAGALRDFKRVLELKPGHEEAAREVAAIEARNKKEEPKGGFFSRLFRR